MNNPCIYCEEQSSKRISLMLEITDLPFSRVFLMRDQYYPGRCVVAFKRHCTEIFEMSEEERKGFFDDVARVAKVIKERYTADKINYGIFGDGMPHVHVHVVPKYQSLDGWGSNFELGDAKLPLDNAELEKRAAEIRLLLK